MPEAKAPKPAKTAQQTLSESESRYRQLVNAVVDYAIFQLDKDGYITTWNPGAERIKGYRADEIIGQHFSRFYTDAERAAGVPAKALKQATDTGRFEAEGLRVRKDGSTFHASHPDKIDHVSTERFSAERSASRYMLRSVPPRTQRTDGGVPATGRRIG